MLAAHSLYDYPFSTSIGAALAMLAALAYVQTPVRWARWRFVLFALLCLLLYYLAGAALYVFALCVAIYEVYARGSRLAILGLLAVVAGAKYAIDGVLSTIHPGLLYLHIPSSHPWRELVSLSAASIAVYASFPICASGAGRLGAQSGCSEGSCRRGPGLARTTSDVHSNLFHPGFRVATVTRAISGHRRARRTGDVAPRRANRAAAAFQCRPRAVG